MSDPTHTLWYDFEREPSLDARAGLGPTLDITRATTATVVDHDGLIRTAQAGEARFTGARRVENICLQSETLQTSWTNTNSTDAQAAGIAPNGETTANSLTDDATDGIHRIFQSLAITGPGTATFSVYLKYSDHQWAQLIIADDTTTSHANFDIQNGATGNENSTTSHSIEDVGNGWYRCSSSMTTSGSSGTVQIVMLAADIDTATPTYAGTGTVILIWGAQLENVSGSPSDSENIVLQSENFDVAWTVEANTNVVTNYAVAPNNTTTAARLIDDESTGIGNVKTEQGLTFVTNSVYTASLYAKADQLAWIRFSVTFMGALDLTNYFDIGSGIVGGTVGADVTSTFIENVGNGWFRIGFTFTSDVVDTSGQFEVLAADANDDVAVDRDGTSSILIWGAQLERRSTVGNYVKTTTEAIVNRSPNEYIPTTTAAVYQLSGANDGLLVEEARTNICLQSEDFATTWAVIDAAIVVNQGTAPDGTATMDRLDVAAADLRHCTYQGAFTTTTNADYTASVYVKDDGAGYAGVTFTNGTDDAHHVSIVANLTTGAITDTDVGSTSGTIAASGIEDMGDGVYRIWVAGKMTPTATYIMVFASEEAVPAVWSTGVPVYAGTPGADILVWGAQLEVGAFPLSYIKTETIAVPRNADVVSTADVSWYTADVGTFYIQASQSALQANAGYYSLDNGVGARTIESIYDGANRLTSFGTGGMGIFSPVSAIVAVDTYYRHATGFAIDDAITYTEGSSGAADTSIASYSVPTIFVVGSRYGGAAPQLNGHIKEIRYYNERKPNSWLEDASSGVFAESKRHNLETLRHNDETLLHNTQSRRHNRVNMRHKSV